MFTFKSSIVVAALIASTFAIPAPDAGAKPFTLQNGKDALALNDKFQSLTATSKCTDGEDACVTGKFAICANGKFVLMDCAAGTICSALPLVNKPGTAVTCTTTDDRDRRIAATGASADGSSSDDGSTSVPSDNSGSDGASDGTANQPPAAPANSAPAPAAAKGSGSGGVDLLQNGKDAQAQNAKNANLTPDSACTDGENACINGDFAECANGKFVLTPCGSGLQCFALPLLKKPGISNTCVTKAETAQRIKDTGAGSIDGN